MMARALRALQRNLRVFRRHITQIRAERIALHDPREILIRIRGIHAEKIMIGRESVHQTVVDGASVRQHQCGVLSLIVPQARYIVGGDVLKQRQSAGAANINLPHMAHVEEARRRAHRQDALRVMPEYSTGMSQPQ